MNHRIEAILLLLRSRHDFDFAPETWSGQLVRRGAIAGEGPSTRIDCPDCQGKGRRKVRGFDCPCDRCKGVGRLTVDSYTLRQVGTYDAPMPMVRSVLCDRCGGLGVWKFKRCEPCLGSGRVDVPLGVLNGNGNGKREERTGDPRLDAGIIRGQAGSYDELTVAMGRLNAFDLYAYRAVVALEDGGKVTTLGFAGLTFIEPLMPEPIRVPSSVRFNDGERERQLGRIKGRQAGQENLRRRNERIRQLRYREQMSVHQIRQEFPELSRSLVYAILEEAA